MDAVPLETPIRRGPVLWRRSGDQVLMRRRGNDHLVVLGGTGVALWLALAEPTTVGEMAEALAAAHEAPLAVVTDDVQAAIASLVADGVVIAG